MILIPLEEREFKTIEHYDINLILDQKIEYEIAVINLHLHNLIKGGTGTISCDIIDPTITNPKQILCRFSRMNAIIHKEFYKIDTWNVRRITLTLTGIPATRIALTLGIRPINYAP